MRTNKRPIKMLTRKVGLNKKSKKLASMHIIYKKLRKEFLESEPICKVCKVCNEAQATEVHHRKGRQNEWLNRVEFFLAVCSNCHNYLHNNPKWALEQGYTMLRS